MPQELLRDGRVWKFDPLPVSKNTAVLMAGMSALSKKGKAAGGFQDTVIAVVESLPVAIERSMRAHHTEKQINDFIDTVVLDFGNPDSLSVLGELHLVFLGLNPELAQKKNVPDAG